MTFARTLSASQWQFMKFLVVGGLNTLFGYGIYAFFIFCGFTYYWAALCATGIGVLFNFMTTGKIVFKNAQPKLLIKFIGVYIVLYFLNISLLKLLLIGSDNLYVNGLITVLPIAIIGFFMNKYLVFWSSHETD